MLGFVSQPNLSHALSPQESAAARASTFNGHYTSKTVIDGIYGALERLASSIFAVEA
jgi:hypothetical protein